MSAPMDLNVPFCEKKVLLKKAITACKLGYEAIAINNCLPSLLTNQGKKKKESVKIVTPDELKIDEKELLAEVGPKKKPIRQLSRISTVLSDADQAHIINTDKVQMYDLVAVQPTSEKTFHQACVYLNIDIVTLDVTEKLGFKMKRQTINAAVERGIHFELMYSPAIRDTTMRRYLITLAETFVFYGKGKNLILTSGCEKPIEMRGPHDVTNLGNILFLTPNQARNCITTNCRSLLCHSQARRTVQSVLQIENIEALSPSDSWLLDKCKVEQSNRLQKDSSSIRKTIKDTAVQFVKEKRDTDNNRDDSDIPKAKKMKMK